MSIISDILKEEILEQEKIEMFEKYYKMLIEWNEKMNLTAITDEYDVATKHFLDCILILKTDIFQKGAKIIDVGSGAGFPGVPLKIADDSFSVTLLDSLLKRVGFLDEVINELSLKDVSTIHGRAEDAGHDKNHREMYDIAVSRAVANLASLSELCLPFVKKGGYFVSLKGPAVEEEIKEAENAIRILDGRVEKVVKYTIPTTDITHNTVIIKKLSNISTKYPRKAPKPTKNPLK